MLRLYFKGYIIARFDVSSDEAMKIIELVEENAVDEPHDRRWVYKCKNGEAMIPCGMPGGTAWEIVEY